MAHMPSKSSIIERNAGMENKAPPTGQPAMQPLAGQPLPQTPQASAALAAGPDNMNAHVIDQMGKPQGPATIKAGEIVFSIESIIGAGNGDYDKGAKLLLGLHDKLQDHGEAIVQKQSLAGAPQKAQEQPQQEEAPQGLAGAQNAPQAPQGLPITDPNDNNRTS